MTCGLCLEDFTDERNEVCIKETSPQGDGVGGVCVSCHYESLETSNTDHPDDESGRSQG